MKTLYISPDCRSIEALHGADDGSFAVVDKLESAPVKADRILSIGQVEHDMLDSTTGGRELDRRAMEWLKKWADEPVFDGKSIKHLLEYHGTSLWWFGETMLFRESVRGNPSLREVVQRVDALLHLIETHNPDAIFVADTGSFTGKCATAVATAKKIRLSSKGNDNNSRKADELYPFLVSAFKGLRSLNRELLCKANRERYSSRDGKPDVLLLSYYHSIRKDVRSGADKTILRDAHLADVADALGRKGFGARSIYVDSSYPLGLGSVRTLAAPRCPLDLYGRSLGQVRHARRFYKLWRSLSGSPQFRGSLRYHGVDLWPMLQDHLAFFFLKQYPEAACCIDTMDMALASEKPRVVVMHNETGFYGRAMIAAARAAGVKTIGVGHGNMTDKEVEYVHTWDGDSLPCPIPDVTVTFGERDKRLLLSLGGYRDESIVVTGSPQYDKLARPDEIYTREKLAARFGVGDRKIVAVTTQPFPVASERAVWLRAILSAANRTEGAFFVVKPHPAESTEMHECVLTEVGCKNAAVAKDVDTMELMHSADLTVTSWSMTGLESMILGTPLVIVNLSGREDIYDYVKSGAALGAYIEADIEPAIKRALGEQLPPAFQESVDKFVLDQAYKIDGKASERIAEVVEKMAKGEHV